VNPVTTEIRRVLAEAAALEREPVRPGEDVVADRAERRCRIQARFDALLAESCAPGYTGDLVTTEAPRFFVVPEDEREEHREAADTQARLLAEWWRDNSFGEDIVDDSLLEAMLMGCWTFAGWPPDMIDGQR
jgi:hypothetical protein